MVGQDEVESALSGADEYGARSFPPIERDRLALDWGSDRLQLRVQGIGQYGRRSGAQRKADSHGGADQIAAHNSPRRDDRQPHWTHDPPVLRLDSAQCHNYGVRHDLCNALRPAGITNWSIALDCGEEDTSRLDWETVIHEATRGGTAPCLVESN
jgi:hypothetical protein